MAVLLGASAASVLAVTFVQRNVRVRGGKQFAQPPVTLHLYLLLDLVLIAGATVWIILDRRRAAVPARGCRRADRPHRRRAAKHRSDLQAMQARVEPQFLFNTLAQVRAL